MPNLTTFEEKIGAFLKEKTVLPIHPSDVCLSQECHLRQPISNRSIFWRQIRFLSELLIISLVCGFIGAVATQIVLAQNHPYPDGLNQVVTLAESDSIRIDLLEKEVERDEQIIRDQQHTIDVMQGGFLAFASALGLLIFFMMLAGKKIKSLPA